MPLQRASMPGDFFQLGNLLFQAWQSETFPFSLFGQSPGDVAGYAISLLSQAGRRIILPDLESHRGHAGRRHAQLRDDLPEQGRAAGRQ